MFIARVCQCLESNKIPYAVVGGYAVALHGAVRGTVDVDLIISLQEDIFVAVEKAMNSLGLHSRLPVTAKEVFHFRKEYIENRNLIAWSFINFQNPMEVVDIVITDNLDDCAIVEKKVAN